MKKLAVILIAISFLAGRWSREGYVNELKHQLYLHQTVNILNRPSWDDPKASQAERVRKLEQTFAFYRSPLLPYAGYFVHVADRYGLDYRILPAIAFTESTLCKHYIARTRNCFGWGSGNISFNSFDQSIDTVASAISKARVYRSWQKNPSDIFALGKIYNGGDQQAWSNTVLGFMGEVARR